jgi:hypothetical protein
MHISSCRAALVAALLGLAVSAAAASAAPRAVEATPTTAAKWDGVKTTGANVSWFTDSLRPSGKCDTAGPTSYCDDILVHFTAAELAEGAALKFRIEGFDPLPSDFDLRVYRSDATGEAGEYLDSPEGDFASGPYPTDGSPLAPVGEVLFPNLETSSSDFETKIVDLADTVDEETGASDAYFLVRVVYFAVADGTYKGSASFVPPAAG